MTRTRLAVAAVLVVVAGSTLATISPSPGAELSRWGVYRVSEERPAGIDGMLGRATSDAVPTPAAKSGAPERPVAPAPALRPEPPARDMGATVRLSEVTREGALVMRTARVSLPKTPSLEGAVVRVSSPALTGPARSPTAADDDDDDGAASQDGPRPSVQAASLDRGAPVAMPENSGKASGSRVASAGSRVKLFRGATARAKGRTVNPDFPEMSAASKPVAAAIAASVKPTGAAIAKPVSKPVTTKATATVIKRVS